MNNRATYLESRLTLRLIFAAIAIAGVSYATIAPAVESNAPAMPSGLVFTDQPLFPAWLGALTGSVDIEIASLDMGGNQYRSVRVPVRLGSLGITVSGGTAGFANGDLTFSLVQDAKQTSINIRGKEIDAGAVAGLASTAVTAPFEFEIMVVGSGRSLHEIAASANGTITVDVQSGRIADVDLRRAGQDLFSLMLSGLNPFRGRDRITALDCAKAHLDIVDGVVNAERLFGMQTTAIDIVCGGILNFESEHVDIKCHPEQGMDWRSERSSLVESLHINGTFLQPKLGVNKVGILRQGASLGAGISKLKLPRLRGVEDQSAEPRPCGISLR